LSQTTASVGVCIALPQFITGKHVTGWTDFDFGYLGAAKRDGKIYLLWFQVQKKQDSQWLT
jgi:hypothetical protein